MERRRRPDTVRVGHRSLRLESAPIPVVVVWATFPQRVATSAGTAFVEGEHLADWLLGRSRQLSPDQVAQLSRAAAVDMLNPTAATG